MKDEVSLKNILIDKDALSKLGFKQVKNRWTYETLIIDDQFKLVLEIDENNIVTSDVIEIETQEKFTLYYVSASNGDFVGQMRSEYEKIIDEIKKKCTAKGTFKSEQALLIIDYVREKYGDELEFLWEKFPGYAVLRNKSNNKWYGIILTIEKSKIGLSGEDCIEVIDLRLEPERSEKLVDNKKIFPGYHMNKKHWITILLDKSISTEEIYEYINNSYNLSMKK